MESSLGKIEVNRKTGEEPFTRQGKEVGFKLLDFWQWNASDLINNATRGKIAEFIIANALGLAQGVRHEWEAYDLQYKDVKIEVKASAFIQTWNQKHFSKIVFNISPTRAWSYDKNWYNEEQKRQSDVYIFSVLGHKNQETINPLNLNQWEFYILATNTLNREVPKQKKITLSSLLKLNPRNASYSKIKPAIEEIRSNLFSKEKQ